MSAAAQGEEMITCLPEVGGLIEPGAVAYQYLVGADDQGRVVPDRCRLGERERNCGV